MATPVKNRLRCLNCQIETPFRVWLDMRAIRYIPPGSLVETTGRTFQSRLLLRPSPLMNEIIAGALGRAQRRYQVRLHSVVVLSNHYHLKVTVDSARQLARFEAYFQSKVAREIGRIYGWRQKVWGRRYQAIVVSDEPAAQAGRLEYLVQQGVKEGLVASPRDWPGIHSAKIGESGTIEGTWFDRTQEWCAAQRGEEFEPRRFATPETVTITPIPAWQALDPATRRRLFEEMVERAEELGRRRQEETGRAPLGPAAILRQRPDDLPSTSKRSPAPLIHAATKAVREALRQAYRLFLEAYRVAADRLRAGLPALFPENCFLPSGGYLRPGQSFGPAHCGSP